MLLTAWCCSWRGWEITTRTTLRESYCVSGTGALHILPHLIFTVIRWVRHCYGSYFLDKRPEAQGDDRSQPHNLQAKVRFNGGRLYHSFLMKFLAKMDRKIRHIYAIICYNIKCVMISVHFLSIWHLIQNPETRVLVTCVFLTLFSSGKLLAS